MIKPLSLNIAWHYLRAKKRTHFVSFISLASMLGMAIGVAVLITTLSVINGFDYQIRTRFFAVAPQVTVVAPFSALNSWPTLSKQVKKLSLVKSVAPFASGVGMLVVGQRMQGLQFIGILPKQEGAVSQLAKHIIAGKIDSIGHRGFNLILGESLAERLGVAIGDKLNVYTPQTSITAVGVFPRFRQFTISGIFHLSQGFNFDNSVAYMNMQDAIALFGPYQTVGGLHIGLHNLYKVGQVTRDLQRIFSPDFTITNWTQTFGAFFEALKMEKMILFIILMLIVAVATFNLVSTLVMMVNDKRSEIAILRTLGATPGFIMRSFILQGMLIGCFGTIGGVLGGILLSWNVTAIANGLQHLLGIQFVNASVFFIDFVPSLLSWHDVFVVGLSAFILSLLATIYPALIAFKTQPAEALRYE